MSAVILNGRQQAERVLRAVKQQVRTMKRKPLLATVVVGKRYDSLLYVRLKETAAKQVGIRTLSIRLPGTASQQQLLRTIRGLNQRSDITGILLQLPLPSHLEAQRAIQTLDADKDADGLRDDSVLDSPFLQSILHLVRIGRPRTGPTVILAKATVFRNRLVAVLTHAGLPTTAYSVTKRMPPATAHARTIITALGVGPRLLARHIRPGVVIIDAGIRPREGKTIGDVDESTRQKAKAVSPVPGGVGPLTIAYLLKNVVRLAKKRTARH